MALLGYGICFDVSRYLAVEGVISRRTLGNDSKIIGAQLDRKSTRLNSSHDQISYAVFCLKKKTIRQRIPLHLPSSGGSASRRMSRKDLLLSDNLRGRPEARHRRTASSTRCSTYPICERVL